MPWIFINPAELQLVSLNFYPPFPRLSELLLGPVFVHNFKISPFFFFIDTVSLKEAIQIRTHLTEPTKLSSFPTVCWLPPHSPESGQNKLFPITGPLALAQPLSPWLTFICLCISHLSSLINHEFSKALVEWAFSRSLSDPIYWNTNKGMHLDPPSNHYPLVTDTQE